MKLYLKEIIEKLESCYTFEFNSINIFVEKKDIPWKIRLLDWTGQRDLFKSTLADYVITRYGDYKAMNDLRTVNIFLKVNSFGSKWYDKEFLCYWTDRFGFHNNTMSWKSFDRQELLKNYLPNVKFIANHRTKFSLPEYKFTLKTVDFGIEVIFDRVSDQKWEFDFLCLVLACKLILSKKVDTEGVIKYSELDGFLNKEELQLLREWYISGIFLEDFKTQLFLDKSLDKLSKYTKIPEEAIQFFMG